MATQTEAPFATEAGADSPAASGPESWEARFRGLQAVLQRRTDERDDFAARAGTAEAALNDAEDRYRELQARLSEEEEEPSINLADRPRRVTPSEKPDAEKSKPELLAQLRAIPWPDEWGFGG